MAWMGFLSIVAFTVLIGTLVVTMEPLQETEASSDPFIAEMIHFGGNFAPRGWAFCDGQLLPISQNSALFSLLGTSFGGDGRTTFGLPDLRGRVMVHDGGSTGPGLSSVRLGEKGGSETVTLNTQQIPSHTHGLGLATLQGTPVIGDSVAVTGNALSLTFARTYSTTAPTAVMHTDSIAGTTDAAGGSQSHNNRQPYQSVNCIIALVGTFPSRN